MRLASLNFVRILPVLASLLYLVGCASPMDKSSSQAVVDAAQPVAVGADEDSGAYRLQVGDALDVLFFYGDSFNQKLVIRPDGRISLQLIGELQAAGLTATELQGAIEQSYIDILRRPQVSVIVTGFSLPKAYVNGEVNAPGEIELSTHMTVLQAIGRTGGFTADAKLENVVVLRYREGGVPRFYRLNLDAFLGQGLDNRSSPAELERDCEDSEQFTGACASLDGSLVSDLRLKPFDIVYVPKTRIANVADFFGRYINRIVPLYRNLGLTFNYELSDRN